MNSKEDVGLVLVLNFEVKGKVGGKMLKRSHGVSSRIRFGEKGLIFLLDGVEVCCEELEVL